MISLCLLIPCKAAGSGVSSLVDLCSDQKKYSTTTSDAEGGTSALRTFFRRLQSQ